MGAATEDARVTGSNLVIVRGVGDVELVVQRFVVVVSRRTSSGSSAVAAGGGVRRFYPASMFARPRGGSATPALRRRWTSTRTSRNPPRSAFRSYDVIEELIRSGLVSETLAGRSSMVVLNRSHLAAGPVLALAGLRGELIRRLRERLSAWPVLGAWLFGSVARGDADSDSDVDLLIVADDPQSPVLRERLSRLQADVRSWTGNDLQLVEHSPSSWRKLVRAKNPLVGQIRLDGIALAGDAASLLERRR
jgi:predicted nucleotidyltransferase